MASSQLYDMLAQAYARPSGILSDLSDTAKTLGSGYASFKEAKRLNTPLEDLLGSGTPEMLKGTKLKDLDRVLPLYKLAQENAPVPIVETYKDPRSGDVSVRNIGSIPKNAKISSVTASSTPNTATTNWASATPEQHRLAQAVYEGRVIPTDIGFKDRGTVVMLANEYANQNNLEPLKSYQGNVKKGMEQNLAFGKMGQNVLSLNTALGHASDLLDAYEKVRNTDVAWLNTPINRLREKVNDPNVVALGLNLTAMQGELANVFKASGGTDTEIAKWQRYLNEDLTPVQAAAAMTKINNLLRSRQSALGYQQQSVLGGGGRQLLSPHAQDIQRKLGAQLNAPPSDSPSVNTGTTGTSVATNSNPDPRANKNKILTDNQTGEKFRSDGLRWVPLGVR